MESYLLSEPKVKGYKKRMLSLWLNKGIFWVDQPKSIRRNSWMIELEIEELERNLAENDSYKEKEKAADDTVNDLGEEVRDIMTALESDEEIGNLEEDEVAIIEEIAELLERRLKDKLPTLRDILKRRSY